VQVTLIAAALALAASQSQSLELQQRADRAAEGFDAQCGDLRVSVRRGLISEANPTDGPATVTINDKEETGPARRGLQSYLSKFDALYAVVPSCHSDGALSMKFFRIAGTLNGQPTYSIANMHVSRERRVEFAPETQASPDNFWIAWYLQLSGLVPLECNHCR
jgi:hypothetical protein